MKQEGTMSVSSKKNNPSSTKGRAKSKSKLDSKKPSTKSELSSSQPNQKVHGKIAKDLSEEKLESGRKLIQQFIRSKYWKLYFDIFLLFIISISYGVILYYTIYLLGIAFLIFAIICCILISFTHYVDMKKDIQVALKDLEILMK